MEARSCNFGQTATNFGKERLRVLSGQICAKISPKWKIICAKTDRNLPKLRSATPQFSGGTKTYQGLYHSAAR